jgi:excisionase family DNA binding protein
MGNSMGEEARLLTPEQVAERLSVSRHTVMKWLRDGKITGHKLGGKIWRVHPDDVQARLFKGLCPPVTTTKWGIEEESAMSDARTIRMIQTVRVSHKETVERSWYDVVERTIARTLDENDEILAEEVIDEQVIEEGLDPVEEVIATDEETDADEIVNEEIEEDD